MKTLRQIATEKYEVVEVDPGWFWLKYEGKRFNGMSNPRKLRSFIPGYVRYDLHRVREAARLLRDYGFEVIPPSKKRKSR